MKPIKILFASALLWSCGSGTTEEAAVEGQAHPGMEVIRLSAEQMESNDIRVGSPDSCNANFSVTCNGVVDVPPQSRATLSAPLGGFLKLVKYYEGQRVSKGEILAELEHPDYISIQREYLESKANVALYKNELNRKETLAKADATSERELQEVRTKYNNEMARYQSAVATLNQLGLSTEQVDAKGIQSRLPLRSPISGYITAIHANLGQHVTPEMPLYEIIDDAHMHLELDVFPQDISRIKEGQLIEFQINGDTRVFKGEVKLIGRKVHEETGAFKVHGHAEEGLDNLRPGQFVQAQILAGAHVSTCLPVSAIINSGMKNYVFRQDGDHFEKMEVQIGETKNGFTEVLNLPMGKYIINNAHLLMESEAGHDH